MSEKKILAAIESLQRSINTRFDSLEKRMFQTEEIQQAQSRDIETLFERVDELCRQRPIWRSKDGRKTAVRKEDAYDLFAELGFSRLEAFRTIDKANRLVRDNDGRHMGKTVRLPGAGTVRAVVILTEQERRRRDT